MYGAVGSGRSLTLDPQERQSEPKIPHALVASILAGRCVAFVGSGFSGAAGLPSWESLLRDLLSRPEADGVRPQLEARLQEKTAHAFDEVAQILEDLLKRQAMIEYLRAKLRAPPPTPVMQQRQRWLAEIPFRAILTTNFDGVLRGETPKTSEYRKIFRSIREPWIESLYATPRERKSRPVLKLHGDLGDPESVVLTRRDYRRLLYTNTAYMSFLRAFLVSHTVLYLGFSFTDAYFNELRSELLTLLGHDGGEPIAYAVINDVPEVMRAHYKEHEGIEMLTYDTHKQTDYSGFDRLLKAIHDRTSPVMRFRVLLDGKRLLWVDPRYEMNIRWAAQFFDMHWGQDVLDVVRSADEALEHLASQTANSRRYDLAVCFWGDEFSHQTQEPLGAALLRGIRERGFRIPMIVFADKSVFQKRKREVLELGALGCYYRWNSLLNAIQLALAPEPETS
jgi:hypothetical protein